jgi:hypothetical protein
MSTEKVLGALNPTDDASACTARAVYRPSAKGDDVSTCQVPPASRNVSRTWIGLPETTPPA